MALITCRGLAFAYGAETVLSGVDFAVEAGDYLCIVGENGSGKSTLVKGLLGLKGAQRGLHNAGRWAAKAGDRLSSPADGPAAGFPRLRFRGGALGRLNSLGRRCFYSKADRAEAERELERMGMAEFKNRCYQDLSGGQQQRVLLARALCATKKLLLLDEPVAGLDPVATAEMYNLLKLINLCDGVTVVMVSHDVSAALRYATRILHLGHEQLFFGGVADYEKSGALRR